MSYWYIISVFLHILGAAFWIGGMLFLPLVLLPNIKHHPDRITLLYKTGMKFRFYGWIVLVLLVLTGIGNLYFKGLPFSVEFLFGGEFGKLFSLKIGLFVLMLLISAVHDFYIGTKALEDVIENPNPKFKKIARMTGRINLIIALAIALMGVMLSRGWY